MVEVVWSNAVNTVLETTIPATTSSVLVISAVILGTKGLCVYKVSMMKKRLTVKLCNIRTLSSARCLFHTEEDVDSKGFV